MKMPAKITQLGILTFLCTMEACQVCVSALESRVISLLVRIEPIDIQSALPKVTKDPLPPVKIVILGSYLKSSVIYETHAALKSHGAAQHFSFSPMGKTAPLQTETSKWTWLFSLRHSSG